MTALIEAGARAPGIELPDASGARRRPLSPAPGDRGPALLVFFKDTCPTCRYALPFVERIHEGLAPAGARVVGISQDDAVRTQAIAKELGLTFPILLDNEGYAASKAYGVSVVPTFVVVDEAGAVRRSTFGFRKTDLEQFARDLASGIGAPPPAVYRPGEQVLESKPG